MDYTILHVYEFMITLIMLCNSLINVIGTGELLSLQFFLNWDLALQNKFVWRDIRYVDIVLDQVRQCSHELINFQTIAIN